MRLSILWIGKTRDKRLAALIDDYIERIRHYCRLEINEVREEPRDSAAGPRHRTEREGKKILKALGPGEFWIALDERGDQMTSEEFATLLGRVLEEKPAGAKIIIGGPYGLSQEVLEKAQRRLALSRMTLTHETARLVALDQVYRAFTILRGHRYHH